MKDGAGVVGAGGVYASAAEYLRVHYGLLREDFLRPVREALLTLRRGGELEQWRRCGGDEWRARVRATFIRCGSATEPRLPRRVEKLLLRTVVKMMMSSSLFWNESMVPILTKSLTIPNLFFKSSTYPL